MVSSLSRYSLNYWSLQDLIFRGGGYNVPNMNNINFHKYKFARLFLHTTENNFGKQKYLVLKNSVSNPV